MEVTQKIEILVEAHLKDYFDNVLSIPIADQYPIYRSMDGGTETDCGYGLRIMTEDIGMLEGAGGTNCNIRNVVLAVGVYTPVEGGDNGAGFSSDSYKIRRRIEDNLYTILRTLGDGNDTDMHLFYREKLEIGQGVSIDDLEEGTWHSSGTWKLVVNGELNDMEASPI